MPANKDMSEGCFELGVPLMAILQLQKTLTIPNVHLNPTTIATIRHKQIFPAAVAFLYWHEF